jgi:hypothetical protein
MLQSYKLRSVAPTPLLTPLAIPQALWVAALVLFVVATILVFIKSVRIALRGGADEAR